MKAAQKKLSMNGIWELLLLAGSNQFQNQNCQIAWLNSGMIPRP